jgi:hypothetical protein
MRTPQALAVVALLLVVGACGGGGGGKKSDSAASTGTSVATSVTTATTAGGGGGDCGVHEKNGVQTRTFCGKATATISMGTESVTFPAGECETTGTYVSVNIGTVVLGTGDKATALKATTAYFGMNIGRTPADDSSKPAADKDGTYTASFAANDHGTATTVITGTVVLSANRTRGTMSGTTLDQKAVTGRFSCS